MGKSSVRFASAFAVLSILLTAPLLAQGSVDPGRTVPDLCLESASDVTDAEKMFWNVFHHQYYGQIESLVGKLRQGLWTAQRNQDVCGEFLMNARLGFVRTWQVAEAPQLKRHEGITVDARTFSQDAAEYFQRAVDLSHAVDDPGLPGAGRLTPSVVAGFWIGFFALTEEGQAVIATAKKEGKDPTKALNAATVEKLQEIIHNTGWFNIATPVLLTLQTDALAPHNLHGPMAGKGQNVDEVWEFLMLCAEVDEEFADFVEEYEDRPYVQHARKLFEESPPWNQDDPPANVVLASCRNWHNVPHVYEGSFLVLGDIMAVNCQEGLVPKERCGPNWVEDVQAFYEQAKSHKEDYEAWGYGYALRKRLGFLQQKEPDLSGLMKEIGGLGFPACMMCHQNSTSSPKR